MFKKKDVAVIPGELRKAVWNEKLSLELNYRYYCHLGERFSYLDSFLRYSLALTSLTTVAFWSLIDPDGNLWKWLSGLASILSVLNITFAYDDKREKISTMKYEYYKLWKTISDLWIQIEINNVSKENITKAISEVNTQKAELAKIDSLQTVSESCRKKSYLEVLASNKLKEMES